VKRTSPITGAGRAAGRSTCQKGTRERGTETRREGMR
jgi:hypothetical protein